MRASATSMRVTLENICAEIHEHALTSTTKMAVNAEYFSNASARKRVRAARGSHGSFDPNPNVTRI